MREPEAAWLERDGVSLHYVEWKAEAGAAHEPSVFLLHGLSSNARYWDRLARNLDGRRVVALDQRGHGLTGRPPHAPRADGGYATTELVQDAAFAIERLGLNKPVVGGHSWGAAVALELVGTRAGIASGFVFIDGPVQSASNLFTWEEAQRIMQPPLPRFASFARAAAESRRDFAGAWGDDLAPFVRARVVEDGDALVLTLTAPVRLTLLRGLYESQPDLLWPKITVPAVALLALRSFARVSRSTDAGVKRLQEIAPQVAVRWFDTPHDIPLHMPVEVAAEVEHIAQLAATADRSEAPAG